MSGEKKLVYERSGAPKVTEHEIGNQGMGLDAFEAALNLARTAEGSEQIGVASKWDWDAAPVCVLKLSRVVAAEFEGDKGPEIAMGVEGRDPDRGPVFAYCPALLAVSVLNQISKGLDDWKDADEAGKRAMAEAASAAMLGQWIVIGFRGLKASTVKGRNDSRIFEVIRVDEDTARRVFASLKRTATGREL